MICPDFDLALDLALDSSTAPAPVAFPAASALRDPETRAAGAVDLRSVSTAQLLSELYRRGVTP